MQWGRVARFFALFNFWSASFGGWAFFTARASSPGAFAVEMMDDYKDGEVKERQKVGRGLLQACGTCRDEL